MKKFALLVAALAVLTSCDLLGDKFLAEDLSAIEGTYTGYTDAVNEAGIFEHYPTDGESFTITANDDDTVDLLFESKVWGTYNIEGAQVVEALGVYGIAGTGTVSVTMPDTTEAVEVEYALAAAIKSKTEASIVITMKDLAGGTTVTFFTGEMPAE
jgi:hypothetical protein